jgi:hypothetical protein
MDLSWLQQLCVQEADIEAKGKAHRVRILKDYWNARSVQHGIDIGVIIPDDFLPIRVDAWKADYKSYLSRRRAEKRRKTDRLASIERDKMAQEDRLAKIRLKVEALASTLEQQVLERRDELLVESTAALEFFRSAFHDILEEETLRIQGVLKRNTARMQYLLEDEDGLRQRIAEDEQGAFTAEIQRLFILEHRLAEQREANWALSRGRLMKREDDRRCTLLEDAYSEYLTLVAVEEKGTRRCIAVEEEQEFSSLLKQHSQRNSGIRSKEDISRRMMAVLAEQGQRRTSILWLEQELRGQLRLQLKRQL